MSTYTTLLDIIILLVLGVTIAFCWKLNNKITELKSNKSEMIDFVKSLDNTIINAHKSVVSLKEATQNASDERQKYVKEGNELANDLSFMIDSGNRLINRMEKAIETAKVLEVSVEDKIEKLEKHKELPKKRSTTKKVSQSKKIPLKQQTNS